MNLISLNVNIAGLILGLLFVTPKVLSTCEAEDTPEEGQSCSRGTYNHHHIKHSRSTPQSAAIGESSTRNIQEYERLISTGKTSRQDILTQLSTSRSELCNRPPGIYCNPSTKYRTIDGTCNNIANPYWGSALSPFNRYFPPLYSDGYNSPKGLGNQTPYPPARIVSTTVHQDRDIPDRRISNMVVLFGQFLDHDMALSAIGVKDCCGVDKDDINECFPIPIPIDDPFYFKFNQTCMNFPRSLAYCFPATNGVREQFNANTAFIDLSTVYGSDDNTASQIRERKKGRLIVNNPHENFLPTIAYIEKTNNVNITFAGKYYSGDTRVNEVPGMTAIHTLWHREHNRIAGEIAELHQYDDDDQIYQETRRILAAQMQKVTYDEFLPTLLGPDAIKTFQLNLDHDNEYTYSEYDASLDPTLHNEFTTGAYRVGHTLLNGPIELVQNLEVVGSFLTRDSFFNSEQIDSNRKDGINLILAGHMHQNSQFCDPFVTVDVTNFLFKPANQNFGADLAAKNIQRSRDHAIENYNKFRELCGLPSLSPKWDDPKPAEFKNETWDKFKSVYDSPLQIELYPGGISEIPVPGAVAGPTFTCMMAREFHRLKFGDRFFFTHANQAGSFTPPQLQAISKRSLGDIICDNTDIRKTTRNVFLAPDPVSNPYVSCSDSSRSKLNLNIFVP